MSGYIPDTAVALVSLRGIPGGFPKIPSTDDAYNLVVHLVLGNGILAGIVLGISALKSWYDGIRKTHEGAMRAGQIVVKTAKGIQQMDRGGRVLAVVCMVFLLLSQGLWLAMNFFIGNLAAGLTSVNKHLSRLNQSQIPSWGQFLHALEWDAVSTGYILISLVGLAASYVYATRRKSTDSLSILFAVPGYVYGFCGLVGGTLTLIGNIIDHMTHHGLYLPWAWVILMYSAGVIGTLYVIGTRHLFRAPLAIRGLWSERART